MKDKLEPFMTIGRWEPQYNLFSYDRLYGLGVHGWLFLNFDFVNLLTSIDENPPKILNPKLKHIINHNCSTIFGGDTKKPFISSKPIKEARSLNRPQAHAVWCLAFVN